MVALTPVVPAALLALGLLIGCLGLLMDRGLVKVGALGALGLALALLWANPGASGGPSTAGRAPARRQARVPVPARALRSDHMARRVLGTLASLVVVVFLIASTPARGVRATCGPTWRILDTPNKDDWNELHAVAAAGPDDI